MPQISAQTTATKGSPTDTDAALDRPVQASLGQRNRWTAKRGIIGGKSQLQDRKASNERFE